MDSKRSFFSAQRGAIIIQVAVALLALTAVSALVLDYGVLWSARGQAQNAADAGALAAAIQLLNNPSDTAGAVSAAKATANRNNVWGQYTAASDVLVTTGLTCPASAGGGPGCVRVDVLRGATDRNGNTHTNTLPTFFANLFGVSSQAINATAMAQVSSANAVSCIKPWTLPDKWIEGDETPIGGWSTSDTFNPPTDTYSAPGFKNPDDSGVELLLKGDANAWSAGWVQEITFTGNNSSNDYRSEIEGCPSWVPTVGIYDGSVPCSQATDANPVKGCISVKPGVSQGPTSQGVAALVATDPNASWDSSTNTVVNSCMDTNTCTDVNNNPISISGRIVPIALFNPLAYWNEANAAGSSGCSGQNCVAQVTNLLGFFLEGMCNDVYPNPTTRPAFCGTNSEARKTVVGRIMKYPGTFVSGTTTSSTFAQAVRLVR